MITAGSRGHLIIWDWHLTYWALMCCFQSFSSKRKQLIFRYLFSGLLCNTAKPQVWREKVDWVKIVRAERWICGCGEPEEGILYSLSQTYQGKQKRLCITIWCQPLYKFEMKLGGTKEDTRKVKIGQRRISSWNIKVDTMKQMGIPKRVLWFSFAILHNVPASINKSIINEFIHICMCPEIPLLLAGKKCTVCTTCSSGTWE